MVAVIALSLGIWAQRSFQLQIGVLPDGVQWQIAHVCGLHVDAMLRDRNVWDVCVCVCVPKLSDAYGLHTFCVVWMLSGLYCDLFQQSKPYVVAGRIFIAPAFRTCGCQVERKSALNEDYPRVGLTQSSAGKAAAALRFVDAMWIVRRRT